MWVGLMQTAEDGNLPSGSRLKHQLLLEFTAPPSPPPQAAPGRGRDTVSPIPNPSLPSYLQACRAHLVSAIHLYLLTRHSDLKSKPKKVRLSERHKFLL